MKHYPETKSDFEDLKALNVQPWQVEMLKRNPSYISYGCGEDYMKSPKEDGGWDAGVEIETWREIWEQDELNELVHGYFFLHRESLTCGHCDGEGLNAETAKISKSWYDFEGTWGGRWCDNITQDEVEALVKGGRLREFVGYSTFFDKEKNTWIKLNENREWENCDAPLIMPSAEQINNWQRGKGFGHDSINRWICVKTRAKRLGVYGKCEGCEGRGYRFVEEHGHLGMQLWMIHPRKGASRGVIVKDIQEKDIPEKDIPEIEKYFKQALERTQIRFNLVAGIS